METREISDMYGLADYINESEYYPDDVEDIIERNGWIICDKDWEIARNPNDGSLLEFDETGKVVVREDSRKTNIMETINFKGREYTKVPSEILDRCGTLSDIIDVMKDGEYVRWYDRYVLKKDGKVISCYVDDMDNCTEV